MKTCRLARWWRRWPEWAKSAMITPGGVVPDDEDLDYYKRLDELMGINRDGWSANPVGIYRGRAWPFFWRAKVEVG